MQRPRFVGFFLFLLSSLALLVPAQARTTRLSRPRHRRPMVHRDQRTRAPLVRRVSYVPERRGTLVAPIVRGGPWTAPTYADSTAGDFVDGDDLAVRRAAVEALGRYNGSIVVVDPHTGRILTMVNQRLALSSGFQPCSTIKVAVSLAALSERVVTPTEKVSNVDLTYALAHSINQYFAALGVRMGYDKVSHYAHLFGYGERAGWNILDEQPGHFPPAPPQNGGMGMLTSFGEEISQTPLQLAALMSALANGGTLYYLQYPRNQWDIQHFEPRVKRRLEIAKLIPEVEPGMLGAVKYGTARRASIKQNEIIAGKTGTCTDDHTHLGWFGSFNNSGPNNLVAVVLLTGGRPSIGPEAAAVAGNFYRNLDDQKYFATTRTVTPAALVSTQICCAR